MPFRIVPDKKNLRAAIQISQLSERNARGIRQAFYKLGKDLRKTASDLILEKPKHGRLYRIRRGKLIRKHRASAAGEAPANLSGRLRRSLDFNVVGSERMEFGYRQASAEKGSGDGVFYGKFLERGTRNMKPRPALFLAIKRNERNAIEHFETELKENFNR